MKRIAKLFIGLACVSLGLTACKEDYFDPEAYQAIVKDAFPVSNISPDQDWAIFGTATAVVRVNGDYGEQYRVGIYQENPQTNQTVTQLGFITLNSGEQQTVQFSYLLAKPIVYFTVFDKLNRRVVKPVQASSTTPITVDFFGGNGSSARKISGLSLPSYSRARSWTTRSTTLDIWNGTDGILDYGLREYSLTETQKEMLVVGNAIGVDFSIMADRTSGYVTFMNRYGGEYKKNSLGSSDTNVEIVLDQGYIDEIVASGYKVKLAVGNYTLSRVYITDSPQNPGSGSGTGTGSGSGSGTGTSSGDDTGSSSTITPLTESQYLKEREAMLSVNDWVNPSWITHETVDLSTITTSSDFRSLTNDNEDQIESDSRQHKWYRIESGTVMYDIHKNFNVDQNSLNNAVVYVAGTLHLWGTSNQVTYIVGNGGEIVIEQEVYLGQATRFVVMEGGKITINNSSAIHFNEQKISMGIYNAGEVNFTGTVYMNNSLGSLIYNAGTMTLNYLDNVRYIYNYGTLTMNQEFWLGNNKDHPELDYVFYNDGTCTVGTAHLAEAVNFGTLNGSLLDVEDNYYFNSGVSEFKTLKVKQLSNIGTLVIEENVDDKAERWTVNGCYLHIKKDQTATTGFRRLVMLKNSRLDMDGDMYFQEANGSYMEDKSLVNVGGDFHVPNDGAQMDAPTASGEFAIIKIAGTINMAKWNAMTRPNEGTLYVDWANFNENFASYATIDNKEGMADDLAVAMMLLTMGSEIITETNATANISIPAGECTGTGYNGTPTNQQQPMPETTTFTYRYCFEDNFPQPGDYDFNDCVMTVTPKVTGREVELTVSLEAVGASKLLAGALRVKGVTESEIRSATVAIKSGKDLDTDLTSNILTYIGNYKNSNGNTVTAIDKLGENDDMTILTSDGKTSQAQNDLVIRLFNDAHWTMAGEGKTAQERLIRHFYNTMTSAISPTYPYLGVTPARTITYTITFPDTDAGKAAAAKFGVTSNLDPFIVERHNSIFWEVHTYPFKWDQVLSAYENNTKLNSYRYADGHSGVESDIANYPWAICVPGSFQYPLEYNSICGTRTVTGNTMGTTSETYRYFSSWAENKNNHQDWYEYPTSGMVWTGQ